MNPGGPFKTSSPERKLMGAKNGNGKRNGNGRNNRWNSEKEIAPARAACDAGAHCPNDCFQCPSTCQQERERGGCIHPELPSCLSCEKELREKLGKKYYPEKSNGKGGIDDILYSPLEKKGNSVPPRQNGTKTSLPLRNKTKRFLEEAGKDHAE